MASKKRLCFVIGPIGKHESAERMHADTLLRHIIKPTFSTHFKNFQVERADQISRPGMIDSQVITHLIEADLVIADLTTRNANAFYELGIRHLLQKPVIHLYRRGDEIPADIAPYRAIEFNYVDKFEIRDAKIALRKHVTEAISLHFVVENPVTRSAGFMRLNTLKLNSQEPKKKKRAAPKPTPIFFPGPELRISNTSHVFWSKFRGEHIATWIAQEKGYVPREVVLWRGKLPLGDTTKDFVRDRANALDRDARKWSGKPNKPEEPPSTGWESG